MRAVWGAVAAVVVFASARGFGQGVIPIAPPPAPPPAPGEGMALPNGTDVSRPLTAVEPDPGEPGNLPPKTEPVERVEAVQQQKYTRRGPLGPAWDTSEFLFWWQKAAPVPPLVTGSWRGTPPILGAPGTTLLVGGQAIANQGIAGGRFTFGWSLNDAETLGVEIGYFFLGTRTDSAILSNATPRINSLGLPIIAAGTGAETVFPLIRPGFSTGSVFVTTTLRAQGAEANGVANLIDEKNIKVNGLLGYRFLQVNEGLTVEQQLTSFLAGGSSGPIYDGFSTSNRFHGGQLGLHADLTRGAVFCELTGKVALGQVLEVSRIDGATTLTAALPPPFAVRSFPGGLFALPSNIGRYTHRAFAVVPEGTVRLGVKLGESGRLYLGYNFLYLSDAIRPGDQIDRVINRGQVPALNPGMTITGDRPQPTLTRTDFWAQGLVIGLETRY